MQSAPDPSNVTKNRINFDKKHILKNIKPHTGNNLIMEFQVKRSDTVPGEVRYASFGWSIINLFDSNYSLNTGQFKVPLYKTPTQPDIDIRDIGKIKKISKVVFCFRVAIPKSPLAKLIVQPDTHPNNYQMPYIHTKTNSYDAQLNQDSIHDPKDMVKINQRIEEQKLQAETYECSGINVFIHFVKNYELLGLMRLR